MSTPNHTTAHAQCTCCIRKPFKSPVCSHWSSCTGRHCRLDVRYIPNGYSCETISPPSVAFALNVISTFIAPTWRADLTEDVAARDAATAESFVHGVLPKYAALAGFAVHLAPAVVTEGRRTVWLAGLLAAEDESGRSLAGNFAAQVRCIFREMQKQMENKLLEALQGGEEQQQRDDGVHEAEEQPLARAAPRAWRPASLLRASACVPVPARIASRAALSAACIFSTSAALLLSPTSSGAEEAAAADTAADIAIGGFEARGDSCRRSCCCCCCCWASNNRFSSAFFRILRCSAMRCSSLAIPPNGAWRLDLLGDSESASPRIRSCSRCRAAGPKMDSARSFSSSNRTATLRSRSLCGASAESALPSALGLLPPLPKRRSHGGTYIPSASEARFGCRLLRGSSTLVAAVVSLTTPAS